MFFSVLSGTIFSADEKTATEDVRQSLCPILFARGLRPSSLEVARLDTEQKWQTSSARERHLFVEQRVSPSAGVSRFISLIEFLFLFSSQGNVGESKTHAPGFVLLPLRPVLYG
jgi:hypothetical protein